MDRQRGGYAAFGVADLLILSIIVGWAGWVFACVRELEADVAEGHRPRDAHFSLLPGIPVFPLFAWGLAAAGDALAPTWGTRVIIVLHVMLALATLRAGVRASRRVRAVRGARP